jgi:hypothetical protein
MKSYLKTLAVAAVALTAAAPGFAQSQLAASAGLSPAEAAGLSLTEIAQAKFNRDTRGDDRHEIVEYGVASPAARADLAANAGLTPVAAQGTLTEIAALKFNRDTRGDDRQTVQRSDATMAARSIADNRAWAQLIAGAGLTQEEAAGLSLSEIARAKFDRDTWN